MKEVVEKIKSLLEVSNIEDVWRSLIKTHSRFYSEKHKNVEDFASLKDPYSEYVIFDNDLLKDLTIGQIGVLYEFSRAYTDPGDRKEKGQYFTPDDTARFMAENAVKLGSGVWLDPCSGVGNLSYTLASMQNDPENFVLNNLILQDIDSLALEIAHAIFALHFQNKTKNFYDKISKNFRVQNFLTQTQFEHDYVIVNPPYLNVPKNTSLESSKCGDLYGYFLEQVIKNSKGYISITPQSYVNSEKFTGLRNLITREVEMLDIYVFDNVPDMIFRGFKYGSSNTNTVNSVRASIMVGKVGKGKKNFRITPLLRWATKQRPVLFSKVEKELGQFIPAENSIYPKVGNALSNLYDELSETRRLSSVLSKTVTDFKLFVPTTPRYYISATYRKLSRSSYKVLYFNSEEDRKKAYLLLNSSLTYWWWRVVDGGMTLSQSTLFTLPFPDFKVDSMLVSNLLSSEKTNLVVKANAGKLNENVKHDEDLVKKATLCVLNGNKVAADNLAATHKNSFISAA